MGRMNDVTGQKSYYSAWHTASIHSINSSFVVITSPNPRPGQGAGFAGEPFSLPGGQAPCQDLTTPLTTYPPQSELEADLGPRPQVTLPKWSGSQHWEGNCLLAETVTVTEAIFLSPCMGLFPFCVLETRVKRAHGKLGYRIFIPEAPCGLGLPHPALPGLPAPAVPP